MRLLFLKEMEKPQPIRSILEKTLKSLEIDTPIKTHSIFISWEEIVGNPLAMQTKPRFIRNQILFLDVSNSVWMQQLQFLKPTLLEKINNFLGEPFIKDIRFRLGKISSSPHKQKKTPIWEDERVDQNTLKRIETVIAEIGDEGIRRSLREILIRGAKLERFLKRSK